MPFAQSPAYVFSAEGIRECAPERSGVFALFTPTEWVYVGAADNVRQALFDLLNASGTSLESYQPLSFSSEEAEGSERTLRRDAMIAELRPAWNSRAAAAARAR